MLHQIHIIDKNKNPRLIAQKDISSLEGIRDFTEEIITRWQLDPGETFFACTEESEYFIWAKVDKEDDT